MTLSGNHSTKLSALTKETKSMIRLGNSAYYKLYTSTFWYTFYNMGLPFMLVMSIIVKSRDESSNQECFDRLSIVGETCVFSNFVPKFKDLFLPSSNPLGSALEYYRGSVLVWAKASRRPSTLRGCGWMNVRRLLPSYWVISSAT